jgi:hypothetical protein
VRVWFEGKNSGRKNKQKTKLRKLINELRLFAVVYAFYLNIYVLKTNIAIATTAI